MNELAEKSPPPPRSVLKLDRVTFRGKSSHGLPFREVRLTAREGELIVIQHERAQRTREVASLLQGLVPPLSGAIYFRDQDWLGNDHSRHFRMRSQIGRVFDGPAWIQNANMMENVTLASRHHGIPSKQIRARMREWIDRLDIKDVSRERPAFVEPALLQVYQWIRAMIHQPALLILERPMQLVSSKMLPKLVHAIDDLRSRGGCVLWMTNNPIADEAQTHPDVVIQIQRRRWTYLLGGSDDE